MVVLLLMRDGMGWDGMVLYEVDTFLCGSDRLYVSNCKQSGSAENKTEKGRRVEDEEEEEKKGKTTSCFVLFIYLTYAWMMEASFNLCVKWN
jgi:hypothetical protein